MTLGHFIDKIRNRIFFIKEDVGRVCFFYGKDRIHILENRGKLFLEASDEASEHDLNQEIQFDVENNRIEILDNASGAKVHLTFYAESVISVSQ
jgi:phage-related holin